MHFKSLLIILARLLRPDKRRLKSISSDLRNVGRMAFYGGIAAPFILTNAGGSPLLLTLLGFIMWLAGIYLEPDEKASSKEEE